MKLYSRHTVLWIHESAAGREIVGAFGWGDTAVLEFKSKASDMTGRRLVIQNFVQSMPLHCLVTPLDQFVEARGPDHRLFNNHFSETKFLDP